MAYLLFSVPLPQVQRRQLFRSLKKIRLWRLVRHQVPVVLAQSVISFFVFRSRTNIVALKGVEATHPKLSYQRIATMYDETDLFSTDRDTILREVFTAKGIEVLTTEVFQSGETDFSAQLTRIQALNPDAIFVSALPPEKTRDTDSSTQNSV